MAACGVGVRRAACDSGVRWRRAATACGGACGGGVQRRAADRGNRFEAIGGGGGAAAADVPINVWQ
jgi:hypothetical protein